MNTRERLFVLGTAVVAGVGGAIIDHTLNKGLSDAELDSRVNAILNGRSTATVQASETAPSTMTLTPTATETQIPATRTPTPTETPTNTPTETTLPPTATVEATETQMPTKATSYELVLPETLLSTTQDGIAYITNMDTFRATLGLEIAGKGDYLNNKRASLIAEMLSTDGVSKAHDPNFWMNGGRGRGYKSDDAAHVYSTAELKASIANGERAKLPSLRVVDAGTELRMGLVTSVNQLESTTMALVIQNQLRQADKLSASETEIKAYVSQPGVDKTIRETVSGLLRLNGYYVLAKDLPSSAAIVSGDFATKQDAFTVCITEAGPAGSRANQYEVTNIDRFSKDLEKKTPKNDETTQKGDLRSQVMVLLTVDAKGGPVLDVIELKNTPDDRDPKRALTPDDADSKRVSVNGYRWIPCGGGTGLVITPTATFFVDTTPGIPGKTEIPQTSPTPGGPSLTPPPRETPNIPTVTPVLNNPPSEKTATPNGGNFATNPPVSTPAPTEIPVTPAKAATQPAKTSTPSVQ